MEGQSWRIRRTENIVYDVEQREGIAQSKTRFLDPQEIVFREIGNVSISNSSTEKNYPWKIKCIKCHQ